MSSLVKCPLRRISSSYLLDSGRLGLHNSSMICLGVNWPQHCFLRILPPSQGVTFVPWWKASVYVHLSFGFNLHLLTSSVLVWASITLAQEWHLRVLALGCLCSPPELLGILCSLYFIPILEWVHQFLKQPCWNFDWNHVACICLFWENW